MNQIFIHPGQPQMQVEVILASRQANMPDEKPLYTIRMRYPRPIHGEVMTHRVFSRNARSSRAVPVKTMLNEVRTIPYVPWHWGANQKGMQADKECDEHVDASGQDAYENPIKLTREQAWLEARDAAASTAEAFMNAGYHKQNPNRLLEPFSWMDTLITANEWDNFLWLRDHADAEPHIIDLARLFKQAIDAARVNELEPGEWHLPYIDINDVEVGAEIFPDSMDPFNKWLCKISAARCARISYKPFDGDPSYDRELERYDSLVSSDRVHASPLEHSASPDTLSYTAIQEEPGKVGFRREWAEPSLHGNLKGWIQYRQTIPNHTYTG
jgi:hypothetical protein